MGDVMLMAEPYMTSYQHGCSHYTDAFFIVFGLIVLIVIGASD